MLDRFRELTFPLALAAAWTIATAYTLSLAALPW